MDTKSTTCKFTTWFPKNEEFQQCRQIILSNEYHWDPYAKFFHIPEM